VEIGAGRSEIAKERKPASLLVDRKPIGVIEAKKAGTPSPTI
jgi:hypothetical protein